MYEYISGRKLPKPKRVSTSEDKSELKKANPTAESKSNSVKVATGKEIKSIVKKVTIVTTEKPKDSKTTETKPAVETKTLVTTKITSKSKPVDNLEAMHKLVRFDENKLEEYSRVAPSTKVCIETVPMDIIKF